VVSYDNVLVKAQLSFRLTDGVITSMAPEAEATAMLVEHAYDDSDDAIAALAEALSCVPGLDVDADFLDRDDAEGAEVSGVPAVVRASLTRDGDNWGASLALWRTDPSGEVLDLVGEVEVKCSYDVDSWWGGKDGVQGPNAYPVSGWSGDGWGEHRFWSVSAWLISKIEWSAFDPDLLN
jgi:hypothetical protein